MLGAPVHAYRVFLGRGRDRRDRLVKEFELQRGRKFPGTRAFRGKRKKDQRNGHSRWSYNWRYWSYKSPAKKKDWCFWRHFTPKQVEFLNNPTYKTVFLGPAL